MSLSKYCFLVASLDILDIFIEKKACLLLSNKNLFIYK